MQNYKNQLVHCKNMMTFVVHLERSVARKAQTEAIRAQSPFPMEVISAVDALASSGSSDEVWGLYQSDLWGPQYPYPLKESEIACFRSHRKCWAMIIEKGLDAALIVEDDVEIDPQVFTAALSVVVSALSPGDFVRFPHKKRNEDGETLASEGQIVLSRPRKIALGMVAQLVTRDAATKLLEATEVFDRPVDCVLQMPWKHNARVLSVWPSGIHEKSADLGGSTIGHKAYGFAKIKREIKRPIYRYRISQMSRAHFNRKSKNLT